MASAYRFYNYRVHLLDADLLVIRILESVSYDNLVSITDFTPYELGLIQSLAYNDGIRIGNMRIYRA